MNPLAYLIAFAVVCCVLVAGVALGVIFCHLGRRPRRLARDDTLDLAVAVGITDPALTGREAAYLDQLAAWKLPPDVRGGGRAIADSLRQRTPAVTDAELCATLLTAHAFLNAALEAGDPAPCADGALDVIAAAAADLAAATALDPRGARR